MQNTCGGKKKAITLALKARNSSAEQMGHINLAKMRARGICVCVRHAAEDERSVCGMKTFLELGKCPSSYTSRAKAVAAIWLVMAHLSGVWHCLRNPCRQTVVLSHRNSLLISRSFLLLHLPAPLWTIFIPRSESGHVDMGSVGNGDNLVVSEQLLELYYF